MGGGGQICTVYTSILLIISVYTGYTHKQQRILSLPIETVCKQVNMEKQGLVLVLGLLARTSAGKRTDNFLLEFFATFSMSSKSASIGRLRVQTRSERLKKTKKVRKNVF